MTCILGIETSCDETAASVVCEGRKVLSNVVYSQIHAHSAYGGVVPELAAREHLSVIDEVVSCALDEAGVELESLDAIAVTNGPGLVPALLIGVNFARALAYSRKIRLIPVNHLKAHIYGAFLADNVDLLFDRKSYPILALIVSGGHTLLILFEENGDLRIVGQSIDDAAGEAFDKGAKILGLGYPGGPAIEKVARGGNPAKFAFPRALTGSSGRAVEEQDRFNFSFSGLKTALLNLSRVNDIKDDAFIRDCAASYQEAIVDVLLKKSEDAVDYFGARTMVLSGGVACNKRLREKFSESFPTESLIIAKPEYCTDNAAMIAGAGYYSYRAANNLNRNYDLDVFSRCDELDAFYFEKNA